MVFRISQLIIEYLLYVQNYLSTKKKEIEANVKTIIQDFEEAKLSLVKKSEEVAYLKKELKRKKKALYAYECVFGTNPEKARILLMSQSNPSQPLPQTQPQQSSSRSEREETFGELRGDIKRMQEALFSQLENTIEKKQSQLEKENQKKLDYFQNEFEKFTESFKKQQENLYSTIAKSVTKFTESDTSQNADSASRDEFLQLSTHIQNLIQQNNQQMLTSFERKLNDLSASTKQVKKAENDLEVVELKKKLDTVMNVLQAKQMEQVKPVEVVVNKMSRVESTPAQEETIVVKAKPKHEIVKKEEPVVVAVQRKEEPPKKEKVDFKPKEPKKEPMKEPVKAQPMEVSKPKDEQKDPPKSSVRSTSPPTKNATIVESSSRSSVVIEQPKAVNAQPVSVPKPLEDPKPQPPISHPSEDENDHDQSYTTTTTSETSETTNTTATSIDVSTLGLKERIYRDIELGKVFEEFDDNIAYQHEEDKPWLTSKFKQNPIFRDLQKTETQTLVDHELHVRGIDSDQKGMSESEYARGLKSLQKERDSVVKNNPDHLVIMNALREKVDNIVAESSKSIHPQVAFSQHIDDIINKIQKMNTFDEEKRKLPLETPKTPQSPFPVVGVKDDSEDDEKDTPTVKIPQKRNTDIHKSENVVKTMAGALMQEALKKKKEMDEKKEKPVTALDASNSKQNQIEEQKERRVDQQTTLKSMDFTKNVSDDEQEEAKSVNNTKIIEAEFEDELIEDDHEIIGSTVYEEVGHGDEDDSQYTYEYETATEQDPNETKRGDVTVQEEEMDESFVKSLKNKDTIQTFSAVDEDSDISEARVGGNQQPFKSAPNLQKASTHLEPEEESTVTKVVSKVSKLKAHSSDEDDSDDDDLPFTKGSSSLTNAALGNKFKSLNNMWEDMNKKKNVSVDDSLDLPGSDDFDISSFKQQVPTSKNTARAGASMLSSDVSGFIKTLKEEEDDLDTEEL
ncbi:hypothetical protein C9374_014319 [Naegleria lovaniensis]|uniref:Uncharacterized protein n=1 Tax=Naegleria lovaniensis TaxID=51637 RepID=A0AA88G5E5_NAELO|nr:uncharacterized protein C9374_014319 [Naegleria lovaniensis]KAG2370688.1 hypothetical protein C9374_014319 [Naegleria lovaniensis]